MSDEPYRDSDDEPPDLPDEQRTVRPENTKGCGIAWLSFIGAVTGAAFGPPCIFSDAGDFAYMVGTLPCGMAGGLLGAVFGLFLAWLPDGIGKR